MPTRPLFPLLILAFLFCACQPVPAPTNTPTATFPPSATPLPPTETPTALPPTATPLPTATVTPPPPDVPIYQLAYLDESSGLHLVNSDGFGETVLFEPAFPMGFHGLSWSAKARLFALTGWEVDSSNIVTPTIFTLRLDGSGLIKLFTPPPASAATYGWRIDEMTEIHWSADGKWLVFASLRGQGSGAGGYAPELHRISAKGAGFETFPQHPIAGDAAWSPLGHIVAYTDGIGPDIFGIRVTNFDSHKTLTLKSIPLTAGDGCGQSAWSPDGTRLSFMCAVNKEVALYVVNADDSAPLKLATGIRDYRQQSAWSPDGNWIAYTNGDTLFRIHPDGSGQEFLAQCNGPMLWSPDGTRLAFYQAGDLFVVFVDGRYLQKIASGLDGQHGDTMFTWISEKLP
jgi:WD40 repeat protein